MDSGHFKALQDRYITTVPKLTYASTQLLNIKSENPSADCVDFWRSQSSTWSYAERDFCSNFLMNDALCFRCVCFRVQVGCVLCRITGSPTSGKPSGQGRSHVTHITAVWPPSVTRTPQLLHQEFTKNSRWLLGLMKEGWMKWCWSHSCICLNHIYCK